MREVVCRTLRHEYRLVCPDADVANDLAFMETKPEIVGAALEVVSIPVFADGDFLRMTLPNGALVEGAASHLMSALHAIVYREAFEAIPGAALIHCVTAVHSERPDARILIVGAPGAGKTTLTLRLLSDGYAIEGDEHFVLGSEISIARPRTLRVKAGSLALAPKLAAAIEASPRISFSGGALLYSVSPAISGLPWRIAPGEVESVVFLEANHGGLSRIKPIGGDEALRRLLCETSFPQNGVGPAAARLRTMLVKARRHALLLGDLDRAVGQLRHAVL